MALRVRTGVVIRLPVAVPNLLDGPHLREQVFLAKKLFPLETRPRPYCSSTNLDSHTQSCPADRSFIDGHVGRFSQAS